MQKQDPISTPEQLRSSPVDDVTYDLLQALTSKLEAIEAYQMYADDGGDAAALSGRPAAEDRVDAAERLAALRRGRRGGWNGE